MRYYENQLKKLTDLTTVSIKLSDYSGNTTNNMNLNLESIQVFRDFLNSFEQTLLKNPKSFQDLKAGQNYIARNISGVFWIDADCELWWKKQDGEICQVSPHGNLEFFKIGG